MSSTENERSTQRLALKEYVDFRQYLKDFIAKQRQRGVKLTNRHFAELLGISSSSWLTMLLNGQKGLSKETSAAISTLLGHDSWEQEYFDILVRFNQAKTLDERNENYEKLNALRKKRGASSSVVVSEAQHEFYSHWYYTAVRSLIGMYRIGNNFEKLSKMVSPHITVHQARKAIKVLLKLNMIRYNENSEYYELTHDSISTGRHEFSLAVANFQRESMRLALEALDRYKPGVRDISSVSVGVSKETAEKIRQEIAALRRKIVDMANNDTDADRVMQVNFQCFPLSEPSPDTNRELHNAGAQKKIASLK